MTVERTELSENLGLEIRGLTGRDLVDRVRADECEEALDRHGLVVYRDAHISDADLVTFTRMLGDVVVPPMNEGGDFPEVARITMDPEQSKLAGLRKGNFFWHLDGAQDELPQKATFLVAHEVDPAGGDTEFANTYAAYEALPDDDKELIAGLRVIHRLRASMRVAYPDASEKTRASWDRVPEREHPLVWERADGRRSLLIGISADEVVGWPEDEGRALLDRLNDWATQPRFTHRHRWQVGDLVCWDNTGLLHRATHFEATSRRMLHRTTLVGEELVTN